MARLVLYQSSRALIEPSPETINGLEQAIRWAEIEVPQNLKRYMNDLVYVMALTNQGEARRMSFGPYDPSGHDTSLAWKLPVRRITQNYYLGWKVRQVKPGVWQLYNDSREAYYIEFGINWLGQGRRVRRPIRKMSLRRTMEVMMRTQAYHRIWVDIYANPRTRHRGKGFTQIVQSPAGGHDIWQNISKHQASSVIRGNARKGEFSSNLRSRGGQIQQKVSSKGGGGYTGPMLGRRIR